MCARLGQSGCVRFRRRRPESGVVRGPHDDPSLSDEELLERRRQWFEAYTSQRNVYAPERGEPYTCPCCGHPTLSERGVYEICPECGWEDDGQDDHDSAVVRGGPQPRSEPRCCSCSLPGVRGRTRRPRTTHRASLTRATQRLPLGAHDALCCQPGRRRPLGLGITRYCRSGPGYFVAACISDLSAAADRAPSPGPTATLTQNSVPESASIQGGAAS